MGENLSQERHDNVVSLLQHMVQKMTREISIPWRTTQSAKVMMKRIINQILGIITVMSNVKKKKM